MTGDRPTLVTLAPLTIVPEPSSARLDSIAALSHACCVHLVVRARFRRALPLKLEWHKEDADG